MYRYYSQCGSCKCNTDPCSSCNNNCRTNITAADLGELVYFYGLDENLCPKYQEIADALGLTDCNGNPLNGASIVTCATLQAEICEIFSNLANAGPLVPGTVVIGANCQRYTVPAFQAPLTVTDTNTVDLTLAANNLSAEVILSPDAGNMLEERGNGLYASLCTGINNLPEGPVLTGTVRVITENCQVSTFNESPLVANDSATIDFTTAAPNGHTITASVKLDPAVGNLLEATANGLRLDCEAVESCIAPDPIIPIDTATVNLTVTGADQHTLQADVRLSAAPNNDLEVNGDGLYFSLCEALDDVVGPAVPATPGVTQVVGADCQLYTFPAQAQNLTVSDTLTVDHTLAGNNLSSDVRISSVADNLITVRPDGLAVRESDIANSTVVNAQDTSCIDMNVNTVGSTFTVSASPILSPDAGNQVECRGNGLFVPPADTSVTCAAIQAIFDPSGDVLGSGQEVLVNDCQTYTFPGFAGLDTNGIDTTVNKVNLI